MSGEVLIAVTGAAGKTGRAVTAALSRRGVPVRALVHRMEQAEAGVPGAAESVAVDLTDTGAVQGALDGADAVYLMAPNMFPDEEALADSVIDACGRSGTERVVYHSVIHPYVPAMPHHVAKAEVEARLAASRLDWTVLQPASYFENALGVWDSVRTSGVWPLPYSAAARFTPVALDDVAEIAACALTDPRHRFATYELAGPEVLTTAEMAEIAGEVLGRAVTVDDHVDPIAAAARPPRLQAMFDYYDLHGICGNGTVLAALLRRPPTTWRGWVETHR